MKSFVLSILTCSIILTTISCSKDDPTAEIDQEEVGGATLTFTEVTAKEQDGEVIYVDLDNPELLTVNFSGATLLPPVGEHYHLEVGKSYRLTLKATDFAGRETQNTFVSRADVHQAFILGGPDGALSYQYADTDGQADDLNVGVTGFLTVNQEAETFVLRYVMRHLNPGIKANITAQDWNNTNFTQFTGDNDLDLKLEMHLMDHAEAH